MIRNVFRDVGYVLWGCVGAPFSIAMRIASVAALVCVVVPVAIFSRKNGLRSS